MKKYVAEFDGELLAGLTLGEGASNSNENPACVAALRGEILRLQQLVAELLLKNQCLRHVLGNAERKALANLLRKLGHEAESIAAEEKKPVEKK
jgi:hypothetical protein